MQINLTFFLGGGGGGERRVIYYVTIEKDYFFKFELRKNWVNFTCEDIFPYDIYKLGVKFLISRYRIYIFVVVQFHPWFECYFPLFFLNGNV